MRDTEPLTVVLVQYATTDMANMEEEEEGEGR
jgi:hypothetical protein